MYVHDRIIGAIDVIISHPAIAPLLVAYPLLTGLINALDCACELLVPFQQGCTCQNDAATITGGITALIGCAFDFFGFFGQLNSIMTQLGQFGFQLGNLGFSELFNNTFGNGGGLLGLLNVWQACGSPPT